MKSMILALLGIVALHSCVCLAGGAPGGPGLYSAKSNVIQLNSKNFAKSVFSTEHIWMVEFYAPWCGHCKSLAPEYEKAATNLKGIVRVAAVNCDDERELCGKYDVKGFPTVKFFPSKLTPIKGKKDAFHKIPEDYNGQRTASGIVQFALSKLPSFISPVTTTTLDKFLGESLPKALLFTNKDKSSDLYKALSIDFHNRMILGEAREKDKKLVEKYGIKAFPTLLVFKQGEEEPVRFDGKLGHEALTKFLEPFALPAQNNQREPDAKEVKEPAQEAPIETGEITEILNQAAFDEKIVAKGGLTALFFLDVANSLEDEHKANIDLLTKLGQKLKGKFRIAWTHGPLQSQLVRTLDAADSYPSMVLLNAQKSAATPFRGAFSEQSIEEFLEGALKGRSKSFLYTAPAIADIKESPKPFVPVPEPEDE